MKSTILLSSLIGQLFIGSLAAQAKTNSTTTDPVVTNVQIIIATDDSTQKHISSGKLSAFPEDIIRFTITNPAAFLRTKPSDVARVVMFANGVELCGITGRWNHFVTRLNINSGMLPLTGATADIDILLRRNDSTQKAWNFFYTSGNNIAERWADIHASVGWEGESALSIAPHLETLRVAYYYDWLFWVWLSLFILIMNGFIWLGIRTDALKDKKEGAYSLSLTLLFYWTLLIVGAFIYTLVLTDAVTAMNTSILLLLGVTIATSGGAATISKFTSGDNSDAPVKPKRGFFKDILGDGDSFSVHRIQLFMWNLVLGVYFIIFTIVHKTMPEFSDTLLFLAGFSSVSYLGGKLPENSNNLAKS